MRISLKWSIWEIKSLSKIINIKILKSQFHESSQELYYRGEINVDFAQKNEYKLLNLNILNSSLIVREQ